MALVNIMVTLLLVGEGIALMMCYNNVPERWPIVEDLGKNAGLAAVAGIGLAIWIPLALIVLLTGYVYVDAKRRDMNAGMWVFLVLVMLPAWVGIGFIAYFFSRGPLPYHCPRCGTMVSARFNYCPGCKYSLHPVCAHCQEEIGDMDKFCPHCGSDVAAPVGTPLAG